MRAHVKHAQGIASALAITFCELLTLTIVIALFMLVIPQVITSILSLVSVLPDQLDKAVDKWLQNAYQIMKKGTKSADSIKQKEADHPDQQDGYSRDSDFKVFLIFLLSKH